jgi:hypothetical protein|tara:strand:- start:2223 stop:2489 length:267 start_codon:yes stop_codon:yes gene_type:complete
MTEWLTNYEDIHAGRHYWLWLPKSEHSPETDRGWPTELGYAHAKVIRVHGSHSGWRGFDYKDARHGIQDVLNKGGQFCLVEKPSWPKN